MFGVMALKGQLGLMARMRLAEREAQADRCSHYRGYVYDFVTIAQGDALIHMLQNGWDDLTHIFPPTMRPKIGNIVGHRLDQAGAKEE